jgi:hypothetical protein
VGSDGGDSMGASEAAAVATVGVATGSTSIDADGVPSAPPDADAADGNLAGTSLSGTP